MMVYVDQYPTKKLGLYQGIDLLAQHHFWQKA
jgi:hypothetical protein